MSSSRQQPKIGLVLGSGWPMPEKAELLHHWSYRTLPGLSEVIGELPGHKGQMTEAVIHGIPLLVAEGRLHLYQGFSAHQATSLVRWMHEQGVTHLILTNAAGCLQAHWQPGDVMLINDHINLTGQNPLQSNSPEQVVRFMDCSQLYPQRLKELAYKAATDLPLSLNEGVYASLPGPSYETPAEVRMLQIIGADAVGMSTVLETLQAHALGLPVLGLSFLSNYAAGLAGLLSHHDVLLQIQDQHEHLSQWLTNIIRLMGRL